VASRFKINIANVIENALSLAIVGGLAIGGFYIAQHYFGFFSYQGLKREQVLDTVKKVEEKFPVLSRACGNDFFGDFCRGIYLTDSGMIYYRLQDDGVKASYNLYSVPAELWTTTPAVIPQRFVGKYVPS
jgi:hypothetical protein